MEFRILGPLEVRAGDERVSVRGARRVNLLLRLLISANHIITAAQLADELWADAPRIAAVSTVASHIFLLRGLLGRDRIVTRGDGYSMQVNDDEVDVGGFERDVAAGRRL